MRFANLARAAASESLPADRDDLMPSDIRAIPVTVPAGIPDISALTPSRAATTASADLSAVVPTDTASLATAADALTFSAVPPTGMENLACVTLTPVF